MRMDYPAAVIEKAQQQEELLQRVAAGEELAAVCEELGLEVDEKRLAQLQSKYASGDRTWRALLDGRHGHAQKAHSALCEWLYARKEADDEVRAPQLAQEIVERFEVTLTPDHVNYLLRKRGLTAPPGRPSKHPRAEPVAEEMSTETPDASTPMYDNAGLFFLEGAKVALEIPLAVEECTRSAQAAYVAENPRITLRHIPGEAETLGCKLDHLLYLPVLGLTRPRDLYYYQGTGLHSLYDFTYKYLTVEHFLGQLTRLQVGYPLADALAAMYARTWYPGDTTLYLFADWHVKPHWTKMESHAGHVTMWGRTMPGTKQLILNGTEGHLLGGWNYPIDTHMTHVLVDVEAAMEGELGRPIGCTIMDSEGGGLPLGERYADAGRCYLSVLARQHDYALTDFVVEGVWKPVIDDPEREAVFAHWADSQKAATDPRRFVLLRRVGEQEPTRIYTGRILETLPADLVPWLHRRRWPHNELRIRDLVNGANLNVNYGYTYQEVPNRTRQRQWDKAQTQVETTQRQLSDQQTAIHNLRQQLCRLQDEYAHKRRELERDVIAQRRELRQRQQTGRATRRCQQRQKALRQKLSDHSRRFQKRQRFLQQRLIQHQTRARHLYQQLVTRITARDAIDTATLCRERDLEKDQIMLNLQVLLGNLHSWVKEQYFAPQWRNLSLDKATQMIYRKTGCVSWYADRIEVVLEPYRYTDQQRAMEATCARFNAANVCWRDGRLLRISVRPGEF
jgi:hypothetical protein